MRTFRRPIAFMLLAWYLPACSSYQTTDLAPQEAVVGQEAVKVVLADTAATELIVRNPWVRTDSIGGMTVLSDDWSAPLSALLELRVKRFDGLRTGGLVLGSMVGLVVATYIVAAAICGSTDLDDCFAT